jgi:hypothetical protein
MNDELERMWKVSWPNLMYYPGIFLEILRKNLSQGSRSPEQYFKPGLPEYEAGMLTTRPRRSVQFHLTELKTFLR